MDTSELRFPKGKPRKLEKADRLKALLSVDDRGSAECRKRSGGRCEVVVDSGAIRDVVVGSRCKRRAHHVHHKLSGVGVRGRGASALSANKLHLCDQCHSDIHAHVLVPDGSSFRRVK